MTTDPIAPVQPNSGLDRWLVSLLADPRDLAFAHLISQCLLWITLAVAIFVVPNGWMAAPLYWAGWGLLLEDRFILMLHCTSHRGLFKDRRLNQLIPWVLCPFFGQTPESYYAHHMGMHHPENNLHTDLSTTMRYRRDSIVAWGTYFFRFLFGGLLELGLYHLRKGNRRLFQRLLMGEGGFWLAMVGLAWWNWQATLVVFVLPVLVVRALMMAGNWGQHAFVDAADPSNPYLNSITCINTRYNRRCFNDGYHILHHLRPRTHYTEYAAEFDQNRDEYGKQDAIVFEGIDFFQVWLYLMLGRHDWLARAMVQLPGAPTRSEAERLALFAKRLAPIPG